MDCDATYIVDKYEVTPFDDGTHAHIITSWVTSDLFMCLHKYIDEDEETKATLRESVARKEYAEEYGAEDVLVDPLPKKVLRDEN